MTDERKAHIINRLSESADLIQEVNDYIEATRKVMVRTEQEMFAIPGAKASVHDVIRRLRLHRPVQRA